MLNAIEYNIYNSNANIPERILHVGVSCMYHCSRRMEWAFKSCLEYIDNALEKWAFYHSHREFRLVDSTWWLCWLITIFQCIIFVLWLNTIQYIQTVRFANLDTCFKLCVLCKYMGRRRSTWPWIFSTRLGLRHVRF